MENEVKQMEQLIGGPIPFSRSENEGRPVYFQLARVIQDQIEKGCLKAGTRLPSERKVSGLNHLSLATVRKAFEELVQKGLIHRIQGKGTFVTSTSERLQKLLFYPFVTDFKEKPLITEFTFLNLKKVRGDMKIRQYLALEKNQNLWELRRLILSKSTPFVYCISYFPRNLFQKMGKYQPRDFEKEPLYIFLEKEFNIPTISHIELFGVALAEKNIATHLRINEDHPLLEIEKLIFTHQNIPFEYRKSYCVTDVFKLKKITSSYKSFT
ncbi:MAG: GntR family transcriptional regulator [Desulfotignum sp.]|nr:GntR family transcriptional regulator [Desulfotignum sp.]MCF8126702.1 GntR family transcriptional regulator [Desulfotignum sp.]